MHLENSNSGLGTNIFDIKGTCTQLAEAFLCIEGKPVRLNNYPAFIDIYNGGYKKLLLKTSRQVGKSTTTCNFSIIESISIPQFKTFYISPTQEQTHKYSTDRVGKTILYSPLIKNYFTDAQTVSRVLAKQFRQGSTIYFSYAQTDADRCRGVSADRLNLDEVQDILLESVVPVLKETIRESDYAYELYSGTPKTMENGIEALWQSSTQTEWLIKCTGCNKYSIILSEKQLSKKGPICTNCNTLLNPRNGQWVDLNTEKHAEIKGFHISRPMMIKDVPICWREGTPEHEKATIKWKEIWDNLTGPNPYPISTFRNEVLGISDSQGRQLITKEDLLTLCTAPKIEPFLTSENAQGLVKLAVGIDWSGGGTGLTSRTVVVIIAKTRNGKYRLRYFKIFPGSNPYDELNEIITIVKRFEVKNHKLFIAGDAGEGNMNMDTLRNKFEFPQRIVKIRYVGNQQTYVNWNGDANCYMVHRTTAIDSMMTSIKAGLWEFPKNDEGVMDIPFKDILAAKEHVSQLNRRQWIHASTEPDDFLHALVFARMALQLSTGELSMGSSL